MARRRSRGTGSVFFDHNARCWMAVVALGSRNGKRVRRKVRAGSEREAKAKLERLLRAYRPGTYHPPRPRSGLAEAVTDIRPSPEMLDAAAANRREAAPFEERDLSAAIAMHPSKSNDIHPCLHCGNDYLEGYPHHHATDPNTGYNPMPVKPQDREQLVAVIRAEYLAEIPARIHVQQVPSHAEPIGVGQYSLEAAGWVPGDPGDVIEGVLDTGPLGSPPWSVPFHRRIGSYRFWEGEVVQDDKELHSAPWTRNLNGLRRWCAGNHRTWYEHRGEPICWVLTRLVIEGGYSPGTAAVALVDLLQVAISVDKAERFLFGWDDDEDKHHNGTFDQWWAWTSNDLNGLTMLRVKRPAA